MIFRLTRKLAVKLDTVDSLDNFKLDKNPFVDWTANLFTVQRVQYIIITNTSSLYSILMYGRGLNNHNDFVKGAMSTMHNFMRADDSEFIYRRFIEPGINQVMFSKALNRAVMGSMNELVADAKFHLKYGKISLRDTSFKLNKIPMSLIKYTYPREAFRAMKA